MWCFGPCYGTHVCRHDNKQAPTKKRQKGVSQCRIQYKRENSQMVPVPDHSIFFFFPSSSHTDSLKTMQLACRADSFIQPKTKQ